MPWYTNPVITCKVLNRIANRFVSSSQHNLRSVLDYATESIWKKQEQYYKKQGMQCVVGRHVNDNGQLMSFET